MTNSDAGMALISLLTTSVARAYDWSRAGERAVSDVLAERIFAQVDQSKNTRKKIEVNPATLARYVGRYELAPGMEFDISLSDGQLQVRLGDQPQFPVYAETESKFFFEVVDAQITFVVDGTGKASALILHQGGRDQEAKRLP